MVNECHLQSANDFQLRECVLICWLINTDRSRIPSFKLSFLSMCNIFVCHDRYQIFCNILVSLMHYASCSTYFWMLCEGIYLHTLIIVAVFVGEQQLSWYYLLGWGEESNLSDSLESDLLSCCLWVHRISTVKREWEYTLISHFIKYTCSTI